MKKRLFAVVLSAALGMGLAVPAFASGAEPAPASALAVEVSGPEGGPSKGDMEFTLRDITEEERIDGSRLSTMRTVFTRYGEARQESLKDVYTLSRGDSVTVSGLSAGDSYEGPMDLASLCAWSDPDGDGLYDQQLFTFYEYFAPVTVVPFSSPGPFTRWDYINENQQRYSRCADLSGDNAIVAGGVGKYHGEGSVSPEPSATLSAEFLAQLFGPNTVVRLTLARYGIKDGNYAALEERYVDLYLPADLAVRPEFTDVPEWCAAAVDWAAENGVTTGTTTTTFSPGNDCTETQILTFLWRAEGEPESDAELPFRIDGKNVEYAEGALRWAVEKGMIDETFDIKAKCSRAAAVAYIWQAFNCPEAGAGSGFTDVPAAADYAAAVAWAVELGVTNGFGDAFRPGSVCSRGQIATFLHRAYVPEARLNADG